MLDGSPGGTQFATGVTKLRPGVFLFFSWKAAYFAAYSGVSFGAAGGPGGAAGAPLAPGGGVFGRPAKRAGSHTPDQSGSLFSSAYGFGLAASAAAAASGAGAFAALSQPASIAVVTTAATRVAGTNVYFMSDGSPSWRVGDPFAPREASTQAMCALSAE